MMLRITLFGLLTLIAFQAGAADPKDPTDRAPGPMTDLWIEARLMTAYGVNEVLNPFEIEVDAESGVVTLTGQVENPSEKDLAVRMAKGLGGVTEVRDRLEVADNTGEERTQSEIFRFVSDANTSARIQMRLVWNDTTSGLDIGVETEDGKVTLTGPVSSEEERQMAERIARRTEGVRTVDNELRVAPADTLGAQARQAAREATRAASDAWITASVAASLRFDSTINHDQIDVTTDDGVVTLEGKVNTLAQKKDAAEIARETSGVDRVENRLEVANWI
jgi:osmotically-inducible protein OsmY